MSEAARSGPPTVLVSLKKRQMHNKSTGPFFLCVFRFDCNWFDSIRAVDGGSGGDLLRRMSHNRLTRKSASVIRKSGILDRGESSFNLLSLCFFISFFFYFFLFFTIYFPTGAARTFAMPAAWLHDYLPLVKYRNRCHWKFASFLGGNCHDRTK